jgi:hypothetical protein
MILNSPIISGSLTVTGNISTSGSITLSGSIASSSFASTASFVALAQSASNAVSAATASFANAFTVAGNLTAQTLVVQTITSSVDFVTGSTRFGSILGNTHVFSGSVTMNPGGLFVSSSGNVGIGTTPNTTAGVTELAIGSSNTNPLISGIRDGVSAFSLSSDSGGTRLLERRNLELTIGTNNTTRLTIASTGVATFSESVLSRTYIINEASATRGGLYPYNRVLGSGTDYSIGIFSEGEIFLATGGGTTKRFTMNSSGAATFVSSVAASTSITVTNSGAQAAILSAVSTFADGYRATLRLWNQHTGGKAWEVYSTNVADGGYGGGKLTFVNSTDSVTAMTLTSGGLVGIGITNPSGSLSLRAEQTNTPTIVFQNSLGGPNSAISNYASAGQTFTTIGTNAYVNSAASLARFNTSFASSAISFDEGDIAFSTGTSGITPTGRMRILSGGDINTLGGNIRALGGGYVLRDSANTTTGGLFCPRRNWLGSGTDISPTIAAETGYGIYTYTNGTASPSGPYVAPGGTTWTNGSSDVRKKKNFETTQGLVEILQVEPIKYHFNEDDDDSKKRLGFKAQNILPLIPEMVSETGEIAEDGSPYLTITPDYILPVLVKAIQELKAQNDDLQSQINELKAQ